MDKQKFDNLVKPGDLIMIVTKDSSQDVDRFNKNLIHTGIYTERSLLFFEMINMIDCQTSELKPVQSNITYLYSSIKTVIQILSVDAINSIARNLARTGVPVETATATASASAPTPDNPEKKQEFSSPSPYMIELMASARHASKQLEQCTELINTLNTRSDFWDSQKEVDEWKETKAAMVALNSDLKKKIKKHEKWARNW